MRQPDLFEARAERDLNVARVSEKAERDAPGWKEQAYLFLCDFARTHGDFISEDVSDASRAAGLPQPHDDRAWGAVYQRALKSSVIVQVGAGRSRRRHASICPLWRRIP